MRLSLVLPTYKEAKNLPELLRRVHGHVRPHEVIVVDDDSPDGTWKVAEEAKSTYPHLKVLRRIGKKGLSSAVIDGCDLATGDAIVVMDSDLQHDPAIVGKLSEAIEGGAGIAVASRYREGGSVGEWVTGRRWLSKLGTYVARKLPNVETTDPMSGFFAVRTDLYRAARPLLVAEGFKILFELLAALPKGTRIDEVPLQFQPRLHGESKLSLLVQLQFLKQALRLGLRRVGMTGSRAFTAVVVMLTVVFGFRLLMVYPLFADAAMRATLPGRLREVAQREGVLLSDIWIDWLHDDGAARLRYRKHVRGVDPETCVFLHAGPSTDTNECAF